MARDTRPISWIKAALRDFQKFPIAVQTRGAAALTILAEGETPDIAKPLTGLGSAVQELVLRDTSGTYRVIYALKIDSDIWVVHAFQKKSKSGIKTPKGDVDVIRTRLKRLKEVLQ